MATFRSRILAASALATATKLWLARRISATFSAIATRCPRSFAGADQPRRAPEGGRLQLRQDAASASSTTVFERADPGAYLRRRVAVAARRYRGLVAAPAASARGVALLVLLGAHLGADRPAVRAATAPSCIEQRFGFNKMTPGLFSPTSLKRPLLGAALGLPLAACILWLMERMGELWWLYAWLIWVAFNLLILAALPDRHRAAVQQVLADGRSRTERAHRAPARALRLQGEGADE